METQPQPGSQDPPAQPQPAQQAQLGVGLVDTPAGQRLAVQLTICLTADEAKAMAATIAEVAASMSATGLVLANGAMKLR